MDEEKPPPIPVATRPLGRREALDQSLAEAVSRVRNDPAASAPAFLAMKDTIASAPDADTWFFLMKKLVATALSSWTPATCDPEAFAEAAKNAGFTVAQYGKTTTVVREAAYPSTTGPLLKSICRAFSVEVLRPSLKKLKQFKKAAPEVRTFANHLDELVKAGSLEASTTPKIKPAPRFTLE